MISAESAQIQTFEIQFLPGLMQTEDYARAITSHGWCDSASADHQVLPYRLSGYAAEGSFTILRFTEPELPDLVYLEHLNGAHYLDKRSETELYSRVFDRLTVDAKTPDHTRQLLSKARAEI